MSGGEFAERRMQVRWSDADALGHVNNSIYLSFLEASRAGLIDDALGAGSWWDWVLARIEIDFLHEIPISVPEVTVRSCVLRVGNSSVRTRDEALLPDGTIAARAEAVVVVRNRETGKSRPLADAEKALLERFAYVPPPAGAAEAES